MSTNKLKVQAFRANDLSEDTGKQFELGKSWCDFFEIADTVGDISFNLEFKPISSAYESLNGRQIELQLSGLTNRNDRKAYANGTRSGHSAIKEFFLKDLHLSMKNNSDDYFAIYKANAFDYYLYYIPKLLHDNFIRFFETISPTITISRSSEKKSIVGMCLQQIFYGAPGTGKSKTIKDKTEEAEKEGRLFRTTFHPDSDYSTFVGCYKPTKVKSFKQPRMDMSLDDLAKALGSYYKNEELGKIGGLQQFCLEYYPYIDGEYMSVNVTKLIELAGVPKDYNVEVNKYIKFIHLLPHHDPDKITYEFIPQAFTNAYVKAWNTEEDVYLIIEEINRGNCAQIFGDLFQLLDRKNGVSEYPIDADSDLANYIGKELSRSTRDDFPEGVKEGKKLVLPSNLYIWATMNTSDQSLFPIDSAFKRRWDWKYIKIAEGKQKETHQPLKWQIKVEDEDRNRVRLYDWWKFLQLINRRIYGATQSADKQMGYFFAKAKDHFNGKIVGRIIKDAVLETQSGQISEDYITAETFVNKVLFYLWTDVMKDNEYEEITNLMEKKDGDRLTFPDFFGDSGMEINCASVRTFLDNVMKEEDEWCKIAELTNDKEEDSKVSNVSDEEIDDGLTEVDLKGNGKKVNFSKVTFGDGTVIDEGDRFATYVAALKKFGLEKSAEIGENSKLHRQNLPLICKTVKQTPSSPYSYEEVDGIYIMKGTNSMHRMLIKIGKELNVTFRLD